MNTSHSQNRCKALFATALGTIAMGFATVTSAADLGDLVGPDVPVYYGDLSIDTDAGAAMLLQRIDKAARRVCKPLSGDTLASRANAKACLQAVTAHAVAEVNHPIVQAAFNSRKDPRQPMAGLRR